MNWDAIGAISDAVGAAAVIITLAYLAIQTCVRVSTTIRLARCCTERTRRSLANFLQRRP
jgi:hypothetical protein